jgi:hypothetical protein
MSTANDIFTFGGNSKAGGGAYNHGSSYTVPYHTRQRSIYCSFPKEGEEEYFNEKDEDGRISPGGQQSRMWV